MSGDGRYVAFWSEANLTRGASTYGSKVYLHENGGTDHWVFTVRPHEHAFGAQAVRTASAPRQFIVTNDSTQPLPIRTLELRGPQKQQFAMTSNCPSALPIGDRCTIDVRFMPTTPGEKWASLKVIFDPDGPHPVRTEWVSGTGVR